MDVLLLRTLARKSVMGFGKYYDCNLQNLIDLKRTTYLRWCYYNLSMISFLPDILDEIHIPEDFRIDKPGKDIEKNNELNKILWAKIGGFSKLKNWSHNKKVRKNSTIIKRKGRMRAESKASMARHNHGH